MQFMWAIPVGFTLQMHRYFAIPCIDAAQYKFQPLPLFLDPARWHSSLLPAA